MNEKLVKRTFFFKEDQLEELKLLSLKTGIPQGVFAREAFERELKKYRYITTMEPFNVDEARYLLAGGKSVDEEESLDRACQKDEMLNMLMGRRRRHARKSDTKEGKTSVRADAVSNAPFTIISIGSTPSPLRSSF